MASLLVLNGPNLNLLGRREPEIYGTATLADIESDLHKQCEASTVGLQFVQSNAEAELITAVHSVFEAESDVGYMLLNPAAFTHTSVALRDAILAVGIPFIEVHLSNVHVREAFRRHSYFSDIAEGLVCGLGVDGYRLAAEVALARLKSAKTNT